MSSEVFFFLKSLQVIPHLCAKWSELIIVSLWLFVVFVLLHLIFS